MTFRYSSPLVRHPVDHITSALRESIKVNHSCKRKPCITFLAILNLDKILRINIKIIALGVFGLCLPVMAQGETCALNQPVTYPLQDLIRSESFDWYREDPTSLNDNHPNYVSAFAMKLETFRSRSQTLADVLMLGTLHWDTFGTIALLGLSTDENKSIRFPHHLETLERLDLSWHAVLLRMSRDAFAPWRITPRLRYLQFSNGRGRINDPIYAINWWITLNAFGSYQMSWTLLQRWPRMIRSHVPILKRRFKI